MRRRLGVNPAASAALPQVNAIETGAEALTAVVFHSFHLLLISVDSKGYVRVNNGADGNMLNAFHVSNGEQLAVGRASRPAASHGSTSHGLMRAVSSHQDSLMVCQAPADARCYN